MPRLVEAHIIGSAPCAILGLAFPDEHGVPPHQRFGHHRYFVEVEHAPVQLEPRPRVILLKMATCVLARAWHLIRSRPDLSKSGCVIFSGGAHSSNKHGF